MRTSQLFIPTLREDPSDAEIISHKLLMRAGLIRKAAGGVYTYLPAGYRVLKKIMQIVREEMDRAGGQEVGLPIMQPRELWEESGRWSVYGDEMFRLKDRHGRDFCLGPTHEEIITSLVLGDVHSYRDLPLLLYQIQDKFRDEIRPRFGLMRGREFIMKDLYSFDVDEAGMERSYRIMEKAYRRVFDRIGLDYRVVEADSGAIGGNWSHEFTVLAQNGESVIVYCDTCDYAANQEKAECVAEKKAQNDCAAMETVETPGVHTVDDVTRFFKVTGEQVIKTLIYLADEKPVAVLVRGDRELNEIKLKNYLRANDVALATDETVRSISGADVGSVGPVGLSVQVLADLEVAFMADAVCGANLTGSHRIHVQPGRDFAPTAYVDLRNAGAGDQCPRCEGHLKDMRGIEVGQIFQLGIKYSKALNAVFLDEQGKERPMIMGCYGIGVSRTMASAVEQNFDDDGIIWPMAIAPYQVIIVPVNINDQEQRDAAFGLYNRLVELGIEALIDDRDERPGVKFKDADLIGIPLRVTIGPKNLKVGKAELKKRWEAQAELVDLAGLEPVIQDMILTLIPK
ncbi:MAG: proline--tRNA ligase [Solirubrobacterales bacterium]